MQPQAQLLQLLPGQRARLAARMNPPPRGREGDARSLCERLDGEARCLPCRDVEHDVSLPIRRASNRIRSAIHLQTKRARPRDASAPRLSDLGSA